jgi:hypothetical protein
MRLRVVVEIGVYADSLAPTVGTPFPPCLKHGVRIRAPIALRTMKTEVDERPDPPRAGRRSRHVVEAQGRVISVKELEHLVDVPAGVAELDRVQATLGSSRRNVSSRSRLHLQRGGSW